MPNADIILNAYDAGRAKALSYFAQCMRECEDEMKRDMTRDEISTLIYDCIRELTKEKV